MRLLLDTHAFIWAVVTPEKLSVTALDAMQASDRQVFLSSATAWELATKHRIGKLPQARPLLDDFENLAEDVKAQLLPITHDHAIRAGLMASEHRDPFDRILAAQAQLEDLYVVTRDPAFAALDVRVVW